MSELIDGHVLAKEFKERLKVLVENLKAEHGIVPGLSVIRVGDNPASTIYVNTKRKQAQNMGFNFEELHFPISVSLLKIEDTIHQLNENPLVHGIVVQLPLPVNLNAQSLLSAIDPAKDVDGLHPLNAGKLFQGNQQGFIPCTPLGCFLLLKTVFSSFQGLNALVVGSSNLVGRPMAALLLNHGCTVSIAHKKTRELPKLFKNKDILVVAIGDPQFVKGEWIDEGTTVIDVGINYIENQGIVGDVHFETAQQHARAITPVPGGVGPMTVACLLRNTLQSAFQSAGLSFPRID